MKNILIVEDEPNISDFIKGELEYEGYNVCIKEDGREAVVVKKFVAKTSRNYIVYF